MTNRLPSLGPGALLIIPACSAGDVTPPTPGPATIALSTSSLTLNSLGESIQVTATVRDKNGNTLSATVV